MNDIKLLDGKLNLDSIESSSLPKTCIVTGELVGLFANGGLGTSMTGIAELLSNYGASITVLYTGRVGNDSENWVRLYQRAGINLEILDAKDFPPIVGPLLTFRWTNAWNIFQKLRNETFDVIHFNDTVGEGLYCFLAKRCGLAFEKTLLCLALHSPTEWILESNRVAPAHLSLSCYIAGEKISMGICDLLWGPSRYLLGWVRDHEYKLPRQVFHQQYVMPTENLFSQKSLDQKDCNNREINNIAFIPNEIVFFGRLEERKGLRLFVSTLTRLNEILVQKGILVTFLGKQSLVDGISSQEFLEGKSKSWKFNWKLIDNYGQQEAVAYLKSGQRLAVMASPVDNSPCTVYESLMNDIPFIAAKVGGIPELLDEAYHDTHLFGYRIESLHDLVTKTLVEGIKLPRASVSFLENQRRWLNFHMNWRNYLPERQTAMNLGVWTVLISHQGGLDKLTRTLKSIRTVLDIDGSMIFISVFSDEDLTGMDADGCVVANGHANCRGEALIELLLRSGSNRLLCLNSGVEVDNVPWLKFERLFSPDVDALIPAAHITKEQSVMPQLAGSAALAFFANDFDTGCLVVNLENQIVKEVFTRLDSSRPHLGILDEMYSLGGTVWPYPEPIIKYAETRNVITRPKQSVERLHAFSSIPSKDMYQILAVASESYRELNTSFSPDRLEKYGRFVAFIFSYPRIIRALFGNSVMRRVANVFYKVSRLEER